MMFHGIRTLRIFLLCTALLFPFLYLSKAGGAEFRVIRPILTPGAVMPEGVKPAVAVTPVKREIVEAAVRKIVDAWNNNALEEVLGDEFYDRSRLFDAMDSKVPRDARLNVLSIQGIQTLNQHLSKTDSGTYRVSTVSVTVKTEITFNDPAKGFQRREGTNEYILRIKERIR